jgi:hypothetical protein
VASATAPPPHQQGRVSAPTRGTREWAWHLDAACYRAAA